MIHPIDIAPEAPLPPEWSESSIVRHINDPFSDAALAEPVKGSIDLGPLSIDDPEDYEGRILKVYAGQPDFLNDSQELVLAHQLFMGAVHAILGPAQFRRTTILFTQRRSDVLAGKKQTVGPPHLDSYKDSDFSADCLRIVGLACKGLPTTLLHGELTSEDLTKEGDLINVRDLRRFKKEPIEESRLILLAPSQLHDMTRATEFTAGRLFLRWHART